MTADPRLLDVAGLSVVFEGNGSRVEAVTDVSFSIAEREFVGIVGESGSGKSVTARALLGLVDRPGRVTAGRVRFDGEDVLGMSAEALRQLRGKDITMIFQDPATSLNPVFTVGQQLAQIVAAHGDRLTGERAVALLEQVEIPSAAARLRQYPHELSGGMRQRVMIAMALANDPKLLVADEPTTALDVTIQAQILELLKRLRNDHGLAVLLVSHSLAVVAEVADRVLVFHQGRIVEQGPKDAVLERPEHPYTQMLLRAGMAQETTVTAS